MQKLLIKPLINFKAADNVKMSVALFLLTFFTVMINYRHIELGVDLMTKNKVGSGVSEKDMEQIRFKAQYKSLQVVFWLQFAALFIWVNYDWYKGSLFGINFWILVLEGAAWLLCRFVFEKIFEKRLVEDRIRFNAKIAKRQRDEGLYILEEAKKQKHIEEMSSNIK